MPNPRKAYEAIDEAHIKEAFDRGYKAGSEALTAERDAYLQQRDAWCGKYATAKYDRDALKAALRGVLSVAEMGVDNPDNWPQFKAARRLLGEVE